jgi:pseudouridylate synthase
MADAFLQVNAEVRKALERGRAVVALESTVIAHGLPYPQNEAAALELEAIIRGGGGVPATVGVIGGVPIVGLDPAGISTLAAGGEVAKLSTRDLPLALAGGGHGGTTVAATMALAGRAGIEVFATGGIGGVHRGPLPDVSADITELGRTPMVVVCAGAKSVLDLAATREALETAGVLVLGWQTDELPAFYSAESGLTVDARVESAPDVARIWLAHRELGLPGALLVCVPPPPSTAIPAHEIARVIESALVEAERLGARGKEITPFLLSHVARETAGRSLHSNVALLRNNAAVAVQIAAAVAAV